MHKLYFTRHGETVWNVENKICGMTDSPLTERGRQQARELGEAVKASGVHIGQSSCLLFPYPELYIYLSPFPSYQLNR